MAPGMLAERQRHRQAELVRVDDLVGRDVLEQPVLVDAGLVREGIGAHDRLVRRHRRAGEPLDEARGGSDRETSMAVCACRASPRTRRAITISSSDALPARSPIPLTVHSICCTPASTAASEFATASPRSSWQCAERATSSSSGHSSRTCWKNDAYSCGKHVADRVREVDRRRAGLDGGTADGGDERGVGAGCVLARELDLVDARAGACRPRTTRRATTSSGRRRSFFSMCSALVARKMCARERGASASAAAAASMSESLVRQREATVALFTARATARTPSKSPGEEAANPASITSTPSRSSCSPISTFSSGRRAIPGACSPSRRVVSKIVILRELNVFLLDSPASAGGPVASDVGVCALRRVVATPPRGGESGG